MNKFMYQTIEDIKTATLHCQPATWDEAAKLVLQELWFRQGWKLNSMRENDIIDYYDIGRWDVLARAFFGEFRDINNLTSGVLPIANLLASKQHDYGPQNILKFGQEGLAIRLWDKIARYINLKNRTGQAQNEALVDTVSDIVGYVTISIMLELGWFTLPLQVDFDAAQEGAKDG